MTVDNERASTPVALSEVSLPQGKGILRGEEALAFVNRLAKEIPDTNVNQDSQKPKSLFHTLSPYYAEDDALTVDLISRRGGQHRDVCRRRYVIDDAKPRNGS